MGRWKFEFSAKDPENLDDTWQVGITEEQYRRICNQGHEKAQARIILIKEVMDFPVALIQGWGRQGMDEDCFIYIGKPKEDYHKLAPTIRVPAPPGMVFLVFVLPSGRIDEWMWRHHAEGNISEPNGVKGEIIWQPNQT